MVFCFSAFLLAYCVMTGLTIWGWTRPEKSAKDPKVPVSERPRIGVVIPVRNEMDNILNLLEDLELQDYPKELYEAIVVDDQSEDGTKEIVLENRARFSFSIKVLSLPTGAATGSTKKKAVELGVKASAGEFILTTDGDCRVPKGWIPAFANRFASGDVNFLAGITAFENCRNLFEKVQAAEFAALTGVAAASMRLGFPTMCNAANMAFRKQTFIDVGGFEGVDHIVSGDDGFLLEKISRFDPEKVRFLKDKNAIVRTAPQKTWMAFYHQRKRWASKWKKHASPATVGMAVFIFLFHLSFLISLFFSLSGNYPPPVFLIQWLVKMSFEWALIRKVFHFTGDRLFPGVFATLEVAYSFYAVFFGAAANFGGFTWKGRKYVDLAAVKSYGK